MVWRSGQSYSEDLRSRVLAAVDGGMAVRAAAPVFKVSISYIYKALIRRRQTGEATARSRRGHRPRKLTPAQEAALASHIKVHRDITLAALRWWLAAEHGVRLMWHREGQADAARQTNFARHVRSVLSGRAKEW